MSIRDKDSNTIIDEQNIYYNALIEEYKSLRNEINQASINMFSALSWGATIIGVTIGVGFTVWEKHYVAVLIIFYILLPILSSMSMFLWLGEAARFKRAGDYIYLIEQKVNLLIKDYLTKTGFRDQWLEVQQQIENDQNISHSKLNLSIPLAWEHWLRDTRKSIIEGHLSLIYLARFSFFPIIMCFSFFTGTYYVLSYSQSIPHLSYLKDYIPKNEITVIVLIIVWFLIFIVSMGIACIIVYNLNKRGQSTIFSSK